MPRLTLKQLPSGALVSCFWERCPFKVNQPKMGALFFSHGHWASESKQLHLPLFATGSPRAKRVQGCLPRIQGTPLRCVSSLFPRFSAAQAAPARGRPLRSFGPCGAREGPRGLNPGCKSWCRRRVCLARYSAFPPFCFLLLLKGEHESLVEAKLGFPPFAKSWSTFPRGITGEVCEF